MITFATKLEPGTYYIGDLCYVMHPEWDEFCELTIDGNQCLDGLFCLKDGREFVSFGTKYGDGLYEDQFGNRYPVDAGLIGAINVNNVSDEEKKNLQHGNVITFDTHWVVSYDEDQGIMNFGHIGIDTAGSDYDVEEDIDYSDED